MALTKITSDVISTGAIESTHIASGAISSGHLTGITTDNVSEGSSNTYFTNARARASVSVTGSGLSYDSSTGVIQIGSIANSTLTNSSLTVNSNSVSLGGSVTLDTDDIGEGSSNLYFTNARAQGAISGGTGVTVSGGAISIGQDVATSSTPTFGNITTTGYIAGPATFTIDPAAVGDNTGTLVIAGNLQVDGTTTTINSTTVNIDDLNIQLATGAINAAAANGAGITVDGASATITYDGTNDEWDFNKDINVTGEVTSTALSVKKTGFTRGTFEADGDNQTGIQIKRSNSSNNTDWEIYSPSIDTDLRFYNGGDKLTIDTNGNVGIGTTPGDIRLKVHSNDSDDYIAIFKQTHASNLGTVQIDSPTDSNGRPSRLDFARGGVNKWKTGMVYGDTTNGWGLSDATGSGTALQQTRFLVTPDGKVGIGVTDPGGNAKLEILQAGDHDAHLTHGIAIHSTGNTNFTSMYMGVEDGIDAAYIQSVALDGSFTSKNLLLNANGGNVGIGTASPAHKLHIKSTAHDEPIALFEADTGEGGDVSIRLEGGKVGNPDEIYIEFNDRDDPTNSFTIGMDDDASKLFFGYGALGTTNNHRQMVLQSDGNVGIGTAAPPSTLTVLGTNIADVTANGAGINGLHIARTDNRGENIYAYMTDSTATGSSWAGEGNVAKIESYGNNAFEIGSQQTIPVIIGQENEQKIRVKGDITTHAKFGSTYIESLYTPNGGVQNCRIFEDHLGKWVAVGYFAANAATSIQGTWSSVRGGPTGIGQTETTQFSADWGDSYPTEVRYMGATDFYNFNETKTMDFVHGVPRGRPWKEFFNNAQRRPDAATPHSGTSHMGSVQGPVGSEKYGWECRGAYDGRGRWHNPGYTHHRMSDINSTTHLSCPTAAFTTATSNAFNWNTYQDAKISVHHSLEYSGQDTAGYSAAFGRDDTVIGFYDDYPNSRSNMQASTNNYGSAVYVLMKLPEMQSIGLEGGRSRDHMPGEVVQTKVYERNADISATSGTESTFGYLDFTPLYGNSLLEFNIHANTGSNDGNTVVWKIYQGSSSALGTLIRRTGNQIINNDGNTDGQELPFSWTQYYQLNDDKKSIYRYSVNFSASGATYWGHTYGGSAHSYFTIKEIKQEHNATTVIS